MSPPPIRAEQGWYRPGGSSRSHGASPAPSIPELRVTAAVGCPLRCSSCSLGRAVGAIPKGLMYVRLIGQITPSETRARLALYPGELSFTPSSIHVPVQPSEQINVPPVPRQPRGTPAATLTRLCTYRLCLLNPSPAPSVPSICFSIPGSH